MPHSASRSVIAMAVTILVCPIALQAAELPMSLFGVSLGQKFHLPPDFSTVGEVPVKRILSKEASQGPGLSLFFEPLDHSDAFSFFTGELAGDDTLRSSFRMYVLPVFTETPPDSSPTYEPILITWEAGVRPEPAYNWAKRTCAGLAASLDMVPQTGDYGEEPLYECTFTQDTRSLMVSSLGGESFTLSLRSDLMQRRLVQADAPSPKIESGP